MPAVSVDTTASAIMNEPEVILSYLTQYIRKADVVLAVCLILICVILSIYVYGLGSTGSSVLVRYDGEEYGTYSLDEDRTVEIDTKDGHNQLTIHQGKALMTEANCPDGYCKNQHKKEGGISLSNQTIVCLPNKIVVTIESRGKDTDSKEPDIMTGSPENKTVLEDTDTGKREELQTEKTEQDASTPSVQSDEQHGEGEEEEVP